MSLNESNYYKKYVKYKNKYLNVHKVQKGAGYDLPKYILNLDLPPKDRWKEISRIYKTQIVKIINNLPYKNTETIINLEKNYYNLLKTINQEYAEEIDGIAEVLGIPNYRISTIQLFYEKFAGCKSIISYNNELIYHLRVLEWNLPDLTPITFNVEFKKDNKTLFYGTTWPAFIGLLTGMKPNSFSVSINIKGQKSDKKITDIFSNMTELKLAVSKLENLPNKNPWPISFLVRHVLTSRNSYYDALEKFETAGLISPCYIALVGKLEEYHEITKEELDRMERLTTNPTPVPSKVPNLVSAPNCEILYTELTKNIAGSDLIYEGCIIDRQGNFSNSNYIYKIVLLTDKRLLIQENNACPLMPGDIGYDKYIIKSYGIADLYKYLDNISAPTDENVPIYMTIMIPGNGYYYSFGK
jgi:hypothetical protein|uniref:Acid ceramidase n=1 Tax=Fadolivirus 2 TaxID=2740747 RepID=A0A7D3URR8_9VIRU|nr:acid ceramidase [Fadolivirus 2]